MDLDIHAPFSSSSVSPLLSPLDSSRPGNLEQYKSRWQISMREEEKRQCQRRPLRCKMVLINRAADDSEEPIQIPADCLNFSDGGLYGIVPIGYGVAMGQKFTFKLTIGERGPEPGSQQIVYQHGKIVRTELLLGENGQSDRVGIGVYLYGHRTGCVPMPIKV